MTKLCHISSIRVHMLLFFFFGTKITCDGPIPYLKVTSGKIGAFQGVIFLNEKLAVQVEILSQNASDIKSCLCSGGVVTGGGGGAG